MTEEKNKMKKSRIIYIFKIDDKLQNVKQKTERLSEYFKVIYCTCVNMYTLWFADLGKIF